MEHICFVIEIEEENVNISYKWKVPFGLWEEANLTAGTPGTYGIKIVDRELYKTKNPSEVETVVNKLCKNIFGGLNITPGYGIDEIHVNVYSRRTQASDNEKIYSTVLEPYHDLNSVELTQEVYRKIYNYLISWESLYKDNDESKQNSTSKKKVSERFANTTLSDSRKVLAFFLIYILPVIIFAIVMLCIHFIAFLIFLFLIFRGRLEFAVGKELCADGDFSVSWDLIEYKYHSNGTISSGIEDLDFFLLIIKPIYNFLLCTLFELIDLVSALILKLLFTISSLIFRAFLKNK